MSFFVVIALCFHVVAGHPNGDTNVPAIPAVSNFTVLEPSKTTQQNRKDCLPCCSNPSPVIRDDYVYSAGIGAHKLHTSHATWGEARRICFNEGGNLAVINSKAEALVMKDLFEKTRKIPGTSIGDQAFIGIHDLFLEGDWVTVYGTPLESAGYTSWTTKWALQPDNAGGKEHCGTLLPEGGFNDMSCNTRLSFFCKIPIS